MARRPKLKQIQQHQPKPIDHEERKPQFEYDGFNPVGNKRQSNDFVVGKHRFFAQNYKHALVGEAEAYATVYQLQMKERDYEQVQRLLTRKDVDLQLEPHVIEFLDSGFLVKTNWERFKQDMRSVSKLVPGALFKVEAFGEDFPNDWWISFAIDGKYYQEDIDPQPIDFDPTRLI